MQYSAIYCIILHKLTNFIAKYCYAEGGKTGFHHKALKIKSIRKTWTVE